MLIPITLDDLERRDLRKPFFWQIRCLTKSNQIWHGNTCGKWRVLRGVSTPPILRKRGHSAPDFWDPFLMPVPFDLERSHSA